ncbi:MAG: hypothetical protein IJS78_04895 [Clostridia bacterium]|nr:hypothetical protein [Clostridia bacterium]
MKYETVDSAAFSGIRLSVLSDPHLREGIGTYKEKKLHLILKRYFVRSEDALEVPFRGFVCDGKEGDLITEVMTTSLSGMDGKLAAFLPDCRVNIIFPLTVEDRVIWIDPLTGETTPGRRSPKKENLNRLLSELVFILDRLSSPNLTVSAVYIAADDYRILNGRGADRKIKAEKAERVPTEIRSIVSYDTASDMKLFLPEGLPVKFTRADFSRATRLTGRRLWGAIKVLVETGVIRDSGEGRKPIFYERVPE